MDNNKIRDLSDIMSIDSLIKVSAVNNSLGRLDTSGANWSVYSERRSYSTLSC